VKRKLFDGYLA